MSAPPPAGGRLPRAGRARQRSNEITEPVKIAMIDWLIGQMLPAAALSVGAADLAAFLTGLPGYAARQRIGDYSEAAGVASTYLTVLSQTSPRPRDGDRNGKARRVLGEHLYGEINRAFEVLGPTSVYGKLCRAVLSTAALVDDYATAGATYRAVELIRQVPPDPMNIPAGAQYVFGPTAVMLCSHCGEQVFPTPEAADFHAARGFTSQRPRCAKLLTISTLMSELPDPDHDTPFPPTD